MSNVDYRLVTRLLRAQQSNADAAPDAPGRRALDRLVVRLDDLRAERRRVARLRVVPRDD